MVLHMSSGVLRVIRNRHLWIVLAIFAIGIIFHYPQQMPFTGLTAPFSFLGLTRHAVERILFLVPVTYIGFVFGIKAGLTSLGFALLIMLPRAVFISPSLPDALFETFGIILIGGLVNLWFEERRREREHQQQMLLRLEAAQQELQSQIEVIRTNGKRLAALNDISAILNRSLELQNTLSAATDKAREIVGAETALLFLLDEGTQELKLEVYQGVSEEFAAGVERLKVGEGFNGRVAETGETLLVEDSSHDPRLAREVVRREGLQCQLIVPLKSEGRVVGTLCVARHNQRRFLADEVDLLTLIGNEIGITIENMHFYQTQRLMTEWLRKSEESYRRLFENAHDAIWVHDLEGNIQMVNKAAEKLVGYSVEELCKANVKSFLSEESLNLAREVGRKLIQCRPVDQPYEQRLIRKDGTEAICMLTTSLITSDGEAEAFQNIARDVTMQRHMEENMKFYLQQVTMAQEEERKRIARELHDDTAQALIVLSRHLDSFTSTTDHLSTQDIAHLEKLQQQADAILEGVRRFSQDLRPSILDDLGLLPALEWLTSDVTHHFGIAVGIGVLGPVRRFAPEVELVLFRIAQEALRNVWKHSEASRAWVTVEFGDDRTSLTVKDNGKGFEPLQNIGDLASIGKLGLIGMQERARLIGGKLTVQSEAGKGTTVTAEVPIQNSLKD